MIIIIVLIFSSDISYELFYFYIQLTAEELLKKSIWLTTAEVSKKYTQGAQEEKVREYVLIVYSNNNNNNNNNMLMASEIRQCHSI